MNLQLYIISKLNIKLFSRKKERKKPHHQVVLREGRRKPIIKSKIQQSIYFCRILGTIRTIFFIFLLKFWGLGFIEEKVEEEEEEIWWMESPFAFSIRVYLHAKEINPS